MSGWLETLRALQELDGQLYRLRQDQQRKPKELTQAKQQIDRVQAEGKSAEDELKAIQLKQKQREMEMGEQEEKIRKLQSQLFQVKTNKEYTAMQHEIEQLRADVSVAEEDIIGFLDRAESAKRKQADVHKRVAQEQERFRKVEQQLQQELVVIAEQIQALDAQRQQLAPSVQREILALYQQALDNGDGLALTLLVKESCGGCHMAQRPQVINQVYLKAQPVACESCRRILYVSDDAVVH